MQQRDRSLSFSGEDGELGCLSAPCAVAGAFAEFERLPRAASDDRPLRLQRRGQYRITGERMPERKVALGQFDDQVRVHCRAQRIDHSGGFVVDDGGEHVPAEAHPQHGGGPDEDLRADVQRCHLRRRQFGDRRGHHAGVRCGRVRAEEFFH